MIKKIAINFALRRPSPTIIPMSLPKCEQNDFYSVFVEIPQLKYKLLCKKITSQAIEGWLWVDESDGVDYCLLLSALKDHKTSLKIEHYYKGWVHEYSSPFLFIIQSLLQKHRFLYSKDKMQQAIFNNKKLVSADRIEVLEYILEQTKSNRNYITSPLTIGMQLYSKRLIFHPDLEVMTSHLKLVFESLVSSEDLIKTDGNYKLAPKALITISEHEREEQKHLDSQNNARKTRTLTKAIVALGLANLAFQVVKWYLEAQT
ncbi:hypothetical protein G6329_17350 [Vibrio cholerae]|uniref:hypothetical protein n=1 Tax=Vibrio cholerae TaxID=666 RepID=UPI000D5F20BB|nr:hypothetical protein [Vibrio cholerae]EJB5293961.1 hypothetical protein [Vibrio cholerae]EKF9975265.1 hypothetical protein [Vibrio cholerae]PVX18494.1 hypothetical protein DD565_06265 [Vibrio cholerae]